jgi:hypothetical protein
LRELAQQRAHMAFTAQRDLSNFSNSRGLWLRTVVLVKPLILTDFLKLAHDDVPVVKGA